MFKANLTKTETVTSSSREADRRTRRSGRISGPAVVERSQGDSDRDHLGSRGSARVGGRPKKIALLIIDTLLCALTLSMVGATLDSYSAVRVVALSLAFPVLLYVAGMYEEFLADEPAQVAGQLALVGILFGTLISILSLSFRDLALPRSEALMRVVAVLALLPGWRALVRLSWSSSRRRYPVVLIGDGPVAEGARRVIERSADLRLAEQIRTSELDSWIEQTARSGTIRRGAMSTPRGVVATDSVLSSEEVMQVTRMRRLGIDVQHAADLYEQVEDRVYLPLMDADAMRAWSSLRPAGHEVSERVKRIFDIVGALVLALILAPPAFLAGLLMRLSDGGPIFYSQLRVGLRGKPFRIFKLRSMHVNAEAQTGAVWAMRNDPRIPPLGRFLRVTRLDEVPQLWNVLAGDMSLVGPRPERPEFTEQLAQKIPLFDLRHLVLPGLTGWAQVRYPYGASVKDAERKLEYDLYYIRHWSLWLDLRILVKTVRVVLFGRGAR